MRVLRLSVFALLACALSLSAARPESATKNIVATAKAAGTFQKLYAALHAADLIDTLHGDGPFTVFAPSDAAFAKLPPGTVEKLLRPENKQALAALLTYHVVSGKIPAADLLDRNAVRTLEGRKAAIEVCGSTLRVAGVKVVQADIACSNGVIHVVERVLMPH